MPSISVRKFNLSRYREKCVTNGRIVQKRAYRPGEWGSMVRVFALAVVLAVASGASAGAQQLPPQPPPVKGAFGGDQGNEKERAACHPDVTKYCQKQLDANPNDVLGILGCLQANRASISKGCQEVLASHGQ